MNNWSCFQVKSGGEQQFNQNKSKWTDMAKSLFEVSYPSSPHLLTVILMYWFADWRSEWHREADCFSVSNNLYMLHCCCRSSRCLSPSIDQSNHSSLLFNWITSLMYTMWHLATSSYSMIVFMRYVLYSCINWIVHLFISSITLTEVLLVELPVTEYGGNAVSFPSFFANKQSTR